MEKENLDQSRDLNAANSSFELSARPAIGIPKSKSHFSKLKKAYNETTSKVSTVVASGFRNNNCHAELVTEILAHRDAIQQISALERRPQIFLSGSLDKTAKLWVNKLHLTYM